jgi:hypothetical protein
VWTTRTWQRRCMRSGRLSISVPFRSHPTLSFALLFAHTAQAQRPGATRDLESSHTPACPAAGHLPALGRNVGCTPDTCLTGDVVLVHSGRYYAYVHVTLINDRGEFPFQSERAQCSLRSISASIRSRRRAWIPRSSRLTLFGTDEGQTRLHGGCSGPGQCKAVAGSVRTSA